MVAPSPPKAGPSRAPPRQPERSAKGADCGPGIIIPKKNCSWCIEWEALCLWEPMGHTQSCWQIQQLKKLCWRFEEMGAEGKWRAEGERGARKRLRIVVEETEAQVEEMERRQKEDNGLQL